METGKAMTPSPEQTACVLALSHTTNNLLISACAGGAKTTTMVLMAKALGPTTGKVVALAFGKDASVSLEAKMPYYVESSTFHVYCYAAIGAPV